MRAAHALRMCTLVGLLAACSDANDPGGSDGGGEVDGATQPVSGPGCGKTPAIATGSWVPQKLDVGGTMRDYYMWLPTGYDPSNAYPIVYMFHGCSGSPDRQNNNVPLEKQSGAGAILVRGKAAADCWDTNDKGPDVPYVDALFPAVEGAYCVDATKRDAVGYSSGSFMTHVLGCTHGAQLRAVATIAGGQVGSKCTGNPAALLIHDANDTTVNISASMGARDDHAKRNGCDVAAALTQTIDPLCAQYSGCMAGKPVVWCQTSGKNHDRQDALAAPVFWKFLSGL